MGFEERFANAGGKVGKLVQKAADSGLGQWISKTGKMAVIESRKLVGNINGAELLEWTREHAKGLSDTLGKMGKDRAEQLLESIQKLGVDIQESETFQSVAKRVTEMARKAGVTVKEAPKDPAALRLLVDDTARATNPASANLPPRGK